MSFHTFIDAVNIPKRIADKKIQKEEEKRRLSGVAVLGMPKLHGQKQIFFVLSNALINYFIVLGAAGCFLEPFEIKCNVTALWVCNLFISLFFGMLYFNWWVKIVGYGIIVVGFVYSMTTYQWVIRGGFAYIANIIMEYLEDDMDLPIERRYSTYNTNEEVAVTLCCIFICFSIMLLFNMIISESKGMALIFLFTFPVTQFGMYFDEELNLAYFIMYLLGVTSLYFLRSSTHYQIETEKHNGYYGKELKRQHRIRYDYVSDGTATLGFLLMFALIVGVSAKLTSSVVEEEDFSMSSDFYQLKDSTREFTRHVALVGFFGMLNPTGNSAGGVSNNRLGQVDRINYDFQTDLVVETLDLEMSDVLYFKSFNGTVYEDNYWKTLSEIENPKATLEEYGLTVSDTYEMSKDLLHLYGCTENWNRIKVSNVVANTKYLYLPYFADDVESFISEKTTDDEWIGELKTGWTYTNYYCTFANSKNRRELEAFAEQQYEAVINKRSELESDARLLLEKEEQYYAYVKEVYMEVPERSMDSIREFVERYQINLDSETIIEDVIKVFQQEYEYTLMPGKVPAGKDFVTYFLSESKKGYCTYFASSAVLLFRYAGIPARYAGGYKLSGDTIDDGVVIEEETPEEWLVLGDTDLKVERYEISDTGAHAWVEIYVPRLGWIPVEVTPSADMNFWEQPEEEEEEGIAQYLVTTVFSPENIQNVRRAAVSTFRFVLFVGAIFVLMYLLIGGLIRNKRYREKDVEKRYQNLLRAIRIGGYLQGEEKQNSYEEIGGYLLDSGLFEQELIEEFVSLTEKGKFSKNRLSQEEMEELIRITNQVRNQIYMTLKPLKKIYFKIIKML